ncbi:unnamed protein product [Lupinus luteus]|uniref:Uncharacterized protein n=1 Tax=Lupinus luteus TaxID=3873 RepID=A0AAV1W7P9_LUPLU
MDGQCCLLMSSFHDVPLLLGQSCDSITYSLFFQKDPFHVTIIAMRHLLLMLEDLWRETFPVGTEEFTDKLIQEEELSEDQKDAFKAREAGRKAIAEMSEHLRI